MQINWRPVSENAQAPYRVHDTDAGADLHAALEDPVTIEPGQRRLIPTGIALAIPTGYVGLIHPRSGLAARHGVTVLNTPGTVDSSYRGELKVCLINHGKSPRTITQGDRIAQLVVQKVELPTFTETDTLDNTTRGTSGFGSTGQ